jgi:hypothetical protein
MKRNVTTARSQCDRIAYYISPEGRRCAVPVPAGTEPSGLLERQGRPYLLLITVRPTGDDADAVIDRAILDAVRAADAAGEISALLASEDAA